MSRVLGAFSLSGLLTFGVPVAFLSPPVGRNGTITTVGYGNGERHGRSMQTNEHPPPSLRWPVRCIVRVILRQVVLVQTFRDPPVDFGASTVDELCHLASIAMNDAAAQSSSSLSSVVAVTDNGPAEPAQDSAVTTPVVFFPVWNDRRKKDNRRRPPPMMSSGDGGDEGAVDLDASFEERFSARTSERGVFRGNEPGWGGEREGEGQGLGGDRGSEPEVPSRHKLSTEHEPSPEALGVKVSMKYTGI